MFRIFRKIGNTTESGGEPGDEPTTGCSAEAPNIEGPFGVRLCDDMLNVFCDRVQMVAPRQVNGFFAIQSILYDPTLQALIKPGDEVIQIIFDQYRQHYITVYLTFEEEEPLLRVYDPLLNEASMKGRFLSDTITSSVVRQILDLFSHLGYQEGGNEVYIEYVYDIDPQMDSWSCGYRCIGVILDLLQNRDPSRSLYDIRTIYDLYRCVNKPGEHSWEDIISFSYRSNRCKTGARSGFLWLNEEVFESIRNQEIEEEVRRRELLKRKLIDRLYSHQSALSLNTKDQLKPYPLEQSEFPRAVTDSSPSHLQNRHVPYLSATMQAKYLRRQQAPLFHVQHQYHDLTNSLPTSEEEVEETASQTSQTSQATTDWEELVRQELDDPVDWDRIENERKRWEWTKENKQEDSLVDHREQMTLLQRVSSQSNNENISPDYRNAHSTIKQSSKPELPSSRTPTRLQDSIPPLEFSPKFPDRNGANMLGGFNRLSVQQRTNSENGRNAVEEKRPATTVNDGFVGPKVSAQSNNENISPDYRNAHSTIKQSSKPEFPSARTPTRLQYSIPPLEFSPDLPRNGANKVGGFDRLSAQVISRVISRVRTDEMRLAKSPVRPRSVNDGSSPRETLIIDVDLTLTLQNQNCQPVPTTLDNATYERTISFSNISSISSIYSDDEH